VIVGRNLTGSLRCQYPSGCRAPVDQYLLELTPTERAAILIFHECQTQWNYVGTFGGVIRVGLKYESAAAVAASHGCEFSEELLAAIQICERVMLVQDAEDRAAEAARAKAESNR
jgi:hypothetical protein